MDEHRHIAAFRAAHEAFEHGDREAMRSWFADDFVWHEPGNNPMTRDYRGADEVFGLFNKIGAKTGNHFDTHLQSVLANDEWLVALLDLHAESDAKAIDMPRVNVYRVNPDSRVAERWGYVGNQAAFDDLMS